VNPTAESKSTSRTNTSDWPGWLRIFAPDPPAARKITDPAEVQAAYRTYQYKILVATMIGYAAFYFVRKNLSVAMPLMEKELGITKTSLGLFLTLHGIVYGVSKFGNGFLGDRCNGRTFMVAGLFVCGLINVAFAFFGNIAANATATLLGFTAVAWVMGILWILNGWFQGMGFPPCARLMTHWFPPKVLAMRMSIWNTSHSIGAAAVVGLGGMLVWMGLGWKSIFYVPALIAFAVCIYLWMSLRDTPESLGLPPVEDLDETATAAAVDTSSVDSETAENLEASLEPPPLEGPTKNEYMRRVFTNPYIWIIALANFFVYIVRYAIFDWSPTYFSQAKGFTVSKAAWITATFEIAGIVGMLAAGWLTDNVFGGRGARTCLFYMAACTVAVFALWKLPLHSGLVATVIMALAGFFI
jgi:OPA family glycerol-3-phosphate transporter-like MFS transporter/OPA family sugar phosphate sensor protein UhpC-like MFS transporter